MFTVNASNEEATSKQFQPYMLILSLVGKAELNDSALFFGQAKRRIEGRAHAGILSELMTWSSVALHEGGAT